MLSNGKYTRSVSAVKIKIPGWVLPFLAEAVCSLCTARAHQPLLRREVGVLPIVSLLIVLAALYAYAIDIIE